MKVPYTRIVQTVVSEHDVLIRFKEKDTEESDIPTAIRISINTGNIHIHGDNIDIRKFEVKGQYANGLDLNLIPH